MVSRKNNRSNKRKNKASNPPLETKISRLKDYIFVSPSLSKPSSKDRLIGVRRARFRKYKSQLTGGSGRTVIKSILDDSRMRPLLYIKAQAVTDLFRMNIMTPSYTLEDEIFWFCNSLIKFSDEISDFLSHKAEIEQSLLFDCEERTIKLIENGIEKFGYTLWYIKTLVSLRSYDSLESAKNTADLFKKDLLHSELARILIEQFFFKSEARQGSGYISSFKGIINEIKTGQSASLSDFISLILIPYHENQKRCSINGIYMASNFTIFDQYLLFKEAVAEYTVQKSRLGEELNSIIEYSLSEFFSSIRDTSSYQIDQYATNSNDEESVKLAVGYYAEGHYSKLVQYFDKKIIEKSAGPELIEIYAKSCYLLGIKELQHLPQCRYSELCEIMLNVLRMDKKCSEYCNDMESVLLRFSNVTWSDRVYVQYFNLFPTYFDSKLDFVKRKSLLTNGNATPLQSTFKSTYHYPNFYNEGCKIPSFRALKHKILSILDDEDEALRLSAIPLLIKLQALTNENALPLEYEIIASTVFYRLEKIDELVETITDCIIKNDESFRCFPIRQLVDNYEIRLTSSPSIRTSVLLHHYVKHFSKHKEYILNESYEDYIESLDFERPSEILVNEISLTDIEKYFFSKICIPSVMDISENFESNDELRAERLRIVERLIALDEYNTKEYSLEKEMLVNKTLVEKSLLGIDQGKIHVDIDTLKSHRGKEYKNLFHMYQMVKDEEQGQRDKVQIEIGDDHQFVFMTGNRDGVITRILSTIRKDFATNNEFGLDKYLSAGIRHVFLTTQLRTILEHMHLITEKSNDSYEVNVFYNEKYTLLSNKVLDEFQKQLADFSLKFDDLVEKANNWNQISYDSHGGVDTVFDFTFVPEEADILHSVLEGVDNFDDFFESVIQFMWDKTEACCKEMTQRLNVDFINDLEIIIEHTMQSISSLAGGNIFSDILDVFPIAKNKVIEEVSVVCDWYKRSEDVVLVDVNLVTLIQTSMESFNALHKPNVINFDFNKPIENSGMVLSGDNCKQFNLALITAFDNSVKHGSFGYAPLISISLAYLSDPEFKLVIQNKILLSELGSAPEIFINDLENRITSSEADKLNTQEGGAGTYKIRDLITRALPKVKCDFDINEKEYLFIVTIKGSINENSCSRR